MRLVSAVLGFLLRKAGVLAALVLFLFLGYLLIQALAPALREAVTDRDRLQQVTEERAALEADLEQLRSTARQQQYDAIAVLQVRIDAEIEQGRRNVSAKASEIADLRDDRDEVCGFLDKVAAAVLPGNACKAAEAALDKADASLDTLEGNLAQAQDAAAVIGDPALTTQQKLDRLGEGGDESLERQIDNRESELGQKKAEQNSLEEARDSGAGWVVDQWDRSWRWLAAIALLALVLPGVLRTVSYFLLMPLVSRMHKRIHLAAGSESATAELRTAAAQRTLTIDLGPGEVLSARSEHVRPVQGQIHSRPALRLVGAVHQLRCRALRTESYHRRRAHHLGDAGDAERPRLLPDAHRLHRPPGPGDAPEARRGSHRHAGAEDALAVGSPVPRDVAGALHHVRRQRQPDRPGQRRRRGDEPRGRSTRMEQNLVMGFDSRLAVGVNRTEVFWPYLWGKTPLVDDEFTGDDPLFWQKSTTDGPSNPIARTFDALFSALGKLLGF